MSRYRGARSLPWWRSPGEVMQTLKLPPSRCMLRAMARLRPGRWSQHGGPKPAFRAPGRVAFQDPAADLYGAFPVKRLFWVLLTVLCSERERPFFVPSPAIRFPERAEGVKGPKR